MIIMSDMIWAGEGDDGVALVYDPKIQIQDCPHLFLWNSESGEMEKYIANIARTWIQPVKYPQIANKHIADYKAWYKSTGDAWLKAEIPYYTHRHAVDQKHLADEAKKKEAERLATERKDAEREEAERLAAEREEVARKEMERLLNRSPEERHKERIENLGLEYLGVRPATHSPSRRRITHCYSCNVHLDNSVDSECISCGWILCSCGACGCGYSR